VLNLRIPDGFARLSHLLSPAAGMAPWTLDFLPEGGLDGPQMLKGPLVVSGPFECPVNACS